MCQGGLGPARLLPQTTHVCELLVTLQGELSHDNELLNYVLLKQKTVLETGALILII